MTESTPAAVFEDLATNPTTKAAIMQDSRLGVDEFADKHSQTIRDHYAKGGYQIDFEESYQTASKLWRYLRTP